MDTELLVRVRSDFAQAQRETQSYANTLDGMGNAATRAGAAASRGAAGVSQFGQAGRQGTAVATEFGRVLSDLPYGIQGVANNLGQLAAMIGVGGVFGIAIQAGIAALVIFRDQLADAFTTAEQRARRLTDAVREATDELTIFEGANRNLDIQFTPETVQAAYRTYRTALAEQERLTQEVARLGAEVVGAGLLSNLFGNDDAQTRYRVARNNLEGQITTVARLRGEYSSLYREQEAQRARERRAGRLDALPGTTPVAQLRAEAAAERERLRDQETAANRAERREETAAARRYRLAQTARELTEELARDTAALAEAYTDPIERAKALVDILESARNAYADLNPGQGGTAAGLADLNRQLVTARQQLQLMDPDIASGAVAMRGFADETREAVDLFRRGLVIEAGNLGVEVRASRAELERVVDVLKLVETLNKPKDGTQQGIGTVAKGGKSDPIYPLLGAFQNALGAGLVGGVNDLTSAFANLITLQSSIGDFFGSVLRSLQEMVAGVVAAVGRVLLLRGLLALFGGPSGAVGGVIAGALGAGKTGGFAQVGASSVGPGGDIILRVRATDVLGSARTGLQLEHLAGNSGKL